MHKFFRLGKMMLRFILLSVFQRDTRREYCGKMLQGQLKGNCFICTHYHHRHQMIGNNPMNCINHNYCGLKGNSITAPDLPIYDCYDSKKCCLYDLHKVAAYDEQFTNLTNEEMVLLYQKKYERTVQ